MIQGVLNPNQYDTWFAKIKPVSLVGSTFTIEVPSEFFREYLETHYIDLLGRALRKEIGNDARLMYKVQVVADSTVTMPAQERTVIKNKPVMPQVNTSLLNPFVIPGLQQLDIDPQLNPTTVLQTSLRESATSLDVLQVLQLQRAPARMLSTLCSYMAVPVWARPILHRP